MFLPERYRRNPSQRRPSPAAPEPPTAGASPTEPAEFDQEDAEPDEGQLPDEEAALSDAEFYKQLRRDVEDVSAGLVRSITDAMRPALKNRPWSKRHKIRDRRGVAY